MLSNEPRAGTSADGRSKTDCGSVRRHCAKLIVRGSANSAWPARPELRTNNRSHCAALPLTDRAFCCGGIH